MNNTNPRITKKDKELIKGSMRRAFSRSILRKTALEASVVPGAVNLSRPRVKSWCKCAQCGKLDAKSSMDVDHRDPVIPLDSSLEEIDINTLANRIWCELSNLQILCESCHTAKSSLERKERNKFKKAKKILDLVA